jgi:hypothetical protein
MISIILLVIGIIGLILGSMEIKLGKADLWKLGWAFIVASTLPWGK